MLGLPVFQCWNHIICFIFCLFRCYWKGGVAWSIMAKDFLSFWNHQFLCGSAAILEWFFCLCNQGINSNLLSLNPKWSIKIALKELRGLTKLEHWPLKILIFHGKFLCWLLGSGGSGRDFLHILCWLLGSGGSGRLVTCVGVLIRRPWFFVIQRTRTKK